MSPQVTLEKIREILDWDLPAVTTVTRINEIVENYENDDSEPEDWFDEALEDDE